MCMCVHAFLDFMCCGLLRGLVGFKNLIYFIFFHVLWQSCNSPYLISSCVVVSVPCSTLTVAEVAVGSVAGTAGKGVDVGITGVVQELDNPGSVLTTRKKNKTQAVEFLKALVTVQIFTCR